MIFINILVAVCLLFSASPIQANPVGGLPSTQRKGPGNQIKVGSPSFSNGPGNGKTGPAANTNHVFDQAQKKGKPLYGALQKARPSETIKPVDPPSAPRCFPSPRAHVQDAHEGYEHKAARAFCQRFANGVRRNKVNTGKEEIPVIHTGDDAADDNASATPSRKSFYYANGTQYEFKIKSIDGCPAPDGYNLNEPIKGYKCEKILVDVWKTCYGNAGRGGIITAGCLTYSAHPKY